MTVVGVRGIGMTSARTRERLVARLKEQGIRNPAVLNLIRSAPRHLFVDEALASRAYEDTALPIGLGQTISQPFIVARMTEALLEDTVPEKVLEVGTGCGYQTLILAKLVPQVFTVERIGALQQRARKTLNTLKVRNVRFKHADANWGWPQHAPYDGILVTAAPEAVPPALMQQLAVGGRMVIPVGATHGQDLLLVTRTDKQHYAHKLLDRVSFVPLLEGTE
ncbi:MAG: protein-L-isoaspartate(D-aspartate) O-methyltransferase [Gammaproteobacteria bacterium]|nr:protein-L-isoaspartate(D-aspartate) O-methyltransferase [Gammaproteobacteria bacterium]MBU6508836.1 protein-L-isoaspartate(D-aspartate) O-methyltransferase [Gammaproteobacteria bacterium]MDE1983122.1 protein-L-isoaspartate(D-aspartate) O-methyltransferase [Gammaproteobacteria bacterium]MDE2108340.1 protein-L-isoaspartate(D-aspartate) O-methyltransferase [Gammaproteobacteria bacterium]